VVGPSGCRAQRGGRDRCIAFDSVSYTLRGKIDPQSLGLARMELNGMGN
jgi:hypothetical protein